MARYGEDFDNRSRADFHYWDHYESPLPVHRYGRDYRGGRPGGHPADYARRDRPMGGGFRGSGGRYGRDFAEGYEGRGYYPRHGSTAWGPPRDFGNYNMDRGFRNLRPYRQYDRGWNTGW